jgi:hypothetical protein
MLSKGVRVGQRISTGDALADSVDARYRRVSFYVVKKGIAAKTAER